MKALPEKAPTILDAEPLALDGRRVPARFVTDGDSQWVEPLDAQEPAGPAPDSDSTGLWSDLQRRHALATRSRRLIERSCELARSSASWVRSALDRCRWTAAAGVLNSSLMRRRGASAARQWVAAGAAGRRAVRGAQACAESSWSLVRTAGRAAPGAGSALLFFVCGLLVIAGRRLETGLWQVIFATPRVVGRLGRLSLAAEGALVALLRSCVRLIETGLSLLGLVVAATALLVERMREPRGHHRVLALATVPGYRGGRWARERFHNPPVAAIPLLASIGVALLAWLMLNTMLPTLFRGFQVVETPTLTNRTLSEARDFARAFGLDVSVTSSQPTDDLPKDFVIAQAPNPGTQLHRGGTVKLTVSAGLRPPDVVGQPVDQARVLLVRNGWFAAPEVETRATNKWPPGDVVEQQPGPQEAAPQKGAVKLVVATPNLAEGKPVLTSAGGRAPAAVDGDEESVAWVPGGPPTWIEVNFGGPVTIAEVRLVLAQQVPGPSVIELWAWDVNGRFIPLHLFSQATSDHALLSARLPQPAANVVRLRAATTSSPSPIGWREISVLDR